MKKILLWVFLMAVGLALQAQPPYRHSVGGIGCTMWGFSYKTFWAEKVAFSADVGLQIMCTGGEDWSNVTVSSVVLNPNLMYEGQFNPHWYVFVGGGVSIGYNWWFSYLGTLEDYARGYKYDAKRGIAKGGKLGANVIAGLEYVFKIPLAVQLDFRPGYGVFIKDNVRWHHFDWNLCMGIRYTF